MLQPLPNNTLRTIKITCFACKKNSALLLKPWQEAKKVECPHCHRKEVVIRSL